MSGSLFAAALACLGAGSLVDLVGGTRSAIGRTTPYVLGLTASALLLVVGVHATVSHATTLGIGRVFDVGRTTMRLDPLAGLFLTLMFAVGSCVSACCISWAWSGDGRAHRRGTATGYLLLLAAVAVVVTAADAFVFLFAWEALTVAFYLLTAVTRRDVAQAGAAWATVGMGKVSGASLLLGFLLLSGRSGSFAIASWHAVSGGVHDLAWVLVVAGFGAKVGLVPFQVWLPVGYPAAPGPTRAAMAGIAANVGVYGLWRFLGVLGPPPVWLVIVVLALGGVTALLGIAFAAVQSRLGRVIAYSSIENAGIIVTAYGVALAGADVHSIGLEAVGLLAATLQTVAHAVAKSSLFCALGFMEAATGSDDLDALRGVARRLRWSGAAGAAGAAALAGLPPTIGFVSEWFVLEALMQQFRLGGLALRLGLAGAGALVALTTGLAALTFLRVLGLTFLGRAPDPVRRGGRGGDAGPVGKAGLAGLGLACLAVAAASPWEIRFLSRGLSPLVPRTTTLGALHSPWVLQPVFRGFSILSPSWLWVAMPVAWGGVLLLALVLSHGRLLRVRRVPAWHSATTGVAGPSSYTGFAFANPLRHVLANLLGTRRSRELVGTVAVGDGGAGGERDGTAGDGDGGHAAEVVAHVESRTTVVEPVETYVYRPLWRALLAIGDVARRLQSGRLAAYVAYMLVALLAALAVTAALR